MHTLTHLVQHRVEVRAPPPERLPVVQRKAVDTVQLQGAVLRQGVSQ